METLKTLEDEGYRLSEKKTELFKQQIEWIGHQINQEGIRPTQDKLESIKQLQVPKTQRELKSFLGDVQYLSKFFRNLSKISPHIQIFLDKY